MVEQTTCAERIGEATRLAVCDVANLCPSWVHMGLIDGTRCQGDQVLTHTITRKGSEHLVVVHKLHQAHSCDRGCSVVNGRAVSLARHQAHQAGLSAGRGLKVVLLEAEGEVRCREHSPLLGFAVHSKVRNGAGGCRGWLAEHSRCRAEYWCRRILAVAAHQGQDADQSCGPLHSR